MCFSNFLIVVLCNYSADCWFDIILILISPSKVLAPEDFSSKNLQIVASD